MQKKLRVLIVDDSSMMRHLLKDLLTTDSGIEVVGTAVDPYDAREKLIALRPDVMTLDIEMPRMDGVTFLTKVMQHFPVPTVIVSSLTQEGSQMAVRALAAGAIDVVAKPKLDVHRGMHDMAASLVERVRQAAQARLPVHGRKVAKPQGYMSGAESTHKVIAVAASTGGTEAIKELLAAMPPNAPGIVVVQHMPPVFTRGFADVLRDLTGMDVREAQAGDPLAPGVVLIAPGGFHMELERSGGQYIVKLHKEPPLHGVRPAADYLFKSVARCAGVSATGVLLTGMGKDGAQGLLEVLKAGGQTLVQDEASCVVFGMPREAIRLGAAQSVVALQDMGNAIMHCVQGKARPLAA